MKDRAVEIAGFLAQNGWDSADAMPFDADFSPRRYARLMRDNNTRAILMDADADQKTHSFIDVAILLRQLDISAPEIFAADPIHGLVLMEDFGNANFGRALEAGANAKALYQRAVDVLVHLHKTFDKSMADSLDLPIFGGALFAAQVELFLDAYFPFVLEREATRDEGESFRAAWKDVLKTVESLPQSLLLRDFMPDNLMDLPKRADWRSVGVLDFQDAGLGPAAYDLASLSEVVRRDGDIALLDEMIAYYHQRTKPSLSLTELKNACVILAAQRHMRILGILARLAQKTGRREKLAYIPRIWTYLDQLLQNEALKPVRSWLSHTKMRDERTSKT